ncbi:MAG: peptide ABC transporter substrate-binding protein [Clostridiales bacterium]|nr:peptide ABC transporter substrate-binding protein [Clostridiales bacterium]
MKRQISLSIALMLVLSIMFSSCSRDTGMDKDLNYPIDSDPVCLDPQIASSSTSKLIINNCFEGLVRIDENGKIIPGVAQSWTVSPDGLNYTFSLRSDASWHLIKNFADVLGDNNEESFDARVTAKDFVFAFQRTLSPITKSENAASLYLIKNAERVNSGKLSADKLGIRAQDDYTLIISLESRNSDFLYTLTKAACMPCNEEFFNATKGKYGLDVKYLLCNGPFYLSQWNTDSSVLMRRNDDYKGENAVYPHSVNLTVNTDEASRLEKLTEGIYCASPVSQQVASKLKEKKGITLTEYRNITWLFAFNCDSAGLDNLHIRLAVCSAIDKSAIEVSVDTFAASGFIPESCKVGDENYRSLAGEADFVKFNILKAKEYLSKGLEETELDCVDATLLCTPEHETMMKRLLQKWQQTFGLGMNISIEVTEKAELISRVDSGNYQIAFAPVYANDSSAVAFLQNYMSASSGNIFKYKSSTFDSIINKLLSVGDIEQAVSGCRQAESHLIQNGIISPVFSQSNFFALAKNVSGIYTHPSGENICFIKALRVE